MLLRLLHSYCYYYTAFAAGAGRLWCRSKAKVTGRRVVRCRAKLKPLSLGSAWRKDKVGGVVGKRVHDGIKVQLPLLDFKVLAGGHLATLPSALRSWSVGCGKRERRSVWHNTTQHKTT